MSEHAPPVVLYLQFANPGAFPPVLHSSRILANAGYHLLFLGVVAENTAAIKFPVEHPAEVRCLSLPAWVGPKATYLLYLTWALWWMVWLRPNWLYVSDMMVTPLGWLGAALFRRSTLYHEHDSPVESAHTSWLVRIILACRRRFASRATIVVLPNRRRAGAFQRQLGVKPLVVWNCPERDEALPISTANDSPTLRLIYHGTIVPPRLPMSVIDAIACLSGKVSLTIIGYDTVGETGYTEKLLAHAQVLGIPQLVSYRGAMGREEVLAINRTHHVGLALMPPWAESRDEDAMWGASNKVFDYMACGTPVIVSDLPEWRDHIFDNRYGITCNPNDVQSLVVAFRWYVDHPDERRRMGENARQQIIESWNYQAQFTPVLRRIAE